MKRLGSLLMILGVLVGAGLGIAMAVGVNAWSFWLSVALAKLTFVSALALIGVGAYLRRIALRRERSVPIGNGAA